ncbi:flagellar biosynthesis anti-sigma factor FlgM [Burkholderiales bacterium JOSHI_001]|nr:flagellar biosynthesis anti-sigma factor FlgM [Burkholderiales bacterium JOSHI_001]
MKIGQIDNKSVPSTGAVERKPANGSARPDGASATPAAAPAGAGSAEPSAKVALSSAALAGDFDSEKVDRIAQAIRDGKFQVNAEAIADKLISNAADLLGRSTQ